MRVLLVDDCYGILHALRELLRGQDVEFDVAYTAESGLAALKREKYDALVTDVVFERLSGIWLAEQSRIYGFYGPILFSTGVGDDYNRYWLKRLGTMADKKSGSYLQQVVAFLERCRNERSV